MEVFDTPESKKGFEASRSKKNITCVYYSYIFNGELDEDDEIPVLQMEKLYPHEWLTKKTKPERERFREETLLSVD